MRVVAACFGNRNRAASPRVPRGRHSKFLAKFLAIFRDRSLPHEAGFALSIPVDPLEPHRVGETIAAPVACARSSIAARIARSTRCGPATTTTGIAAATSPPQPSNNYFARHWRGELSLPKSYWVNGLVFGFLAGTAIVALSYAVNSRGEAQPVVWMATLIGTWVVIALLTMWQTVGIWRSATHYRMSGGSFWGGLAKTVTVLGVINLAYNCLFVGTAQLAGIWEIIDGDARVGAHQFKVLVNGQDAGIFRRHHVRRGE